MTQIGPGIPFYAHMQSLGAKVTAKQAQPVLRACRNVLLNATDENFQRRSSVVNGSWPARKDNKPHPLLEETGSLRKAATGRGPGHVTVWYPDGFEYGVDRAIKRPKQVRGGHKRSLGGIAGAAVHNFGYPARNIPQREFMTPNDNALNEVADIIAEFLDSLL